MNLVLKRVYPVITQGLGWTNPDTRVSPNANDHTIDVFPKYIPEGKDSEVGIVVSRRPELIVYLYRRLDFAYESLQLEGETPHILNWDLNGTSHQTIFDPANVREDGRYVLKKSFFAYLCGSFSIRQESGFSDKISLDSKSKSFTASQ